jgi:hypothetical protein
MKILTEQVRRFSTGEDLAPEDINSVFNYARDAVDDVGEKRWCISPLTFQFAPAVNTPVTNATPTNLRIQKFVCPVTCQVLRGFAYSIGTGWTIDFFLAGTSTPATGATSPYLAPGLAVPNSCLEASNNGRVQLVAGQVYDIVVSGTTFSEARLDIVLHVAIDRWTLAGTTAVPSFVPNLLTTDGVTPEAVNANISALTTEAAKFSTAVGMTPILVWVDSIVSGTSVDRRSPRFGRGASSSRQVGTIVRAYLAVVRSAATATTVTAAIGDQGGVVFSTLTASAAALSEVIDSGPLSQTFTNPGAFSGASFIVTFANSDAAVTARCAALIWVRWS